MSQPSKKLKNWWSALCSLSAAWMMMGCASSTPKSSAPIPQALAKPCPKLATRQGVTGADVLRWSADTVRKYQLCAAQVEGLRGAWPVIPVRASAVVGQ